MQIFKAFMKVLRKKLPSAMIYIIVFLAISISMSQRGGEDRLFARVKLNISVIDEDDTPESRALTEYIGSTNNIIDKEYSRDELIDQLYYTHIDYAIVINKGYAEKLAAGTTDDLFSSYHIHESYSTVYMTEVLDQYVSTFRAYTASGMDTEEALSRTNSILSEETEVNYETFSDDDTEFSLSGYFRYIPYIMISVLLSALCPVLLAMNRKDIRYRTNCSSVSSSSYSMQIFAGSTVFVMAVWLLFMIAALLMNGGMFRGKEWLAVINSFIMALVSTSISLLIASFSPGGKVIDLITQVIGLGMSFLCGVFVPLGYLSSSVITVARFLPVYWYVKANNMISGISAYSGSDVAVCLLIELGFAVSITALSILVHRLKYSGGLIPAKA